MTDLNVAIYRRAGKGKIRHWAIWLKSYNPEESVILQLTDNMYGYDYRIADPVYSSPVHSGRLESIIGCGSIREEKHQLALDAILNYPVHNRGEAWNCQSWVFDCLDLLDRMGALDFASQGRDCLEALRE
ncbi:hypothetical protein N7520_004551 [Penicillium odoratum]|uniref:uncharacterized protein n=1 Tax=Penicillium odoratum TaxID=1167516 RepID=UPI0025481596|nr:uncharacterized protein N7520_004551 [Penicillium odoratum]KAJ5764992.1 hypothetical protein N7520_004551 [Penicillium odoratum]